MSKRRKRCSICQELSHNVIKDFNQCEDCMIRRMKFQSELYKTLIGGQWEICCGCDKKFWSKDGGNMCDPCFEEVLRDIDKRKS